MQKITVLLLITLFFSSCGGSKNATTAAVPDRNDVKGNWQITDIRYSGMAATEKLSFTLLDEGGEACLRGSTWNLPNNGKGSYIINGTGCAPGERSIVWSYRKEGDNAYFQYKRMEGGVKAKDITDGYRFRILSADESSLVLESTITYEGNPIAITYTLQRTGN